MKNLIFTLILIACLVVPYGSVCTDWKDPKTRNCCLAYARY
jgi:hypothetical protein